MRSEYSGRDHSHRKKALVLGERALAQIIARQLEDEGFEPIFQTGLTQKRLPPVADPNSLVDIRALLTEFASHSRGKGAVHPGTTPWAERQELASIGQELGLTVLCPPARVLSFFGNKLNFLQHAERLDIPQLVLGFDVMHSVREIENFVRMNHHPFPFVLKTVKGGGSYGILVVQDSYALEKTLPLWLEQLRRNLGEVILFAERYLEGARHIVVPFARFQNGRIQMFPFSDASLQCRYRKIIEFCPAQRIDRETQEQLTQWTHRFVDSCGYVGVGVLEFLVDSSRAYLVGGLPRLNTGFHLWDQVAGTRAVAWQLATIGAYDHGTLPEIKNEKDWDSGVSVRIYTEDSLLHLPQPGEIRQLSGRRTWDLPIALADLSLNYEKNETISIFDSGILGLLTVTAPNRRHVLNVASGVLSEFWVAGSIQTNERFLLELLHHPWVKEEIFHAGFVDEEFVPATNPSAEIIQLFASLFARHPEFPHFLDSAPRDLPSNSTPSQGESASAEQTVPFRWVIGERWIRTCEPGSCKVAWVVGPNYWQENGGWGVTGTVELNDGGRVGVYAFPFSDRWLVRCGSWFMTVRRTKATLAASRTSGNSQTAKAPATALAKTSKDLKNQEGQGQGPKATARNGGAGPSLRALVSGRIHAVLYHPHSIVPAHEPLLSIESLGTLIPHALSRRVRVNEWKVAAESIVHVGQELAHFEVLED